MAAVANAPGPKRQTLNIFGIDEDELHQLQMQDYLTDPAVTKSNGLEVVTEWVTGEPNKGPGRRVRKYMVQFEEGNVYLLLQWSVAPRLKWLAPEGRQGTYYDVIVQQIMAQPTGKGLGTRVMLGLVEITRLCGRGVQLQSTVTPAGRALGTTLVAAHSWTRGRFDERQFYSPIPEEEVVSDM